MLAWVALKEHRLEQRAVHPIDIFLLLASTDFVADAAFEVGIVTRVVVLRRNNKILSLMSA